MRVTHVLATRQLHDNPLADVLKVYLRRNDCSLSASLNHHSPLKVESNADIDLLTETNNPETLSVYFEQALLLAE